MLLFRPNADENGRHKAKKHSRIFREQRMLSWSDCCKAVKLSFFAHIQHLKSCRTVRKLRYKVRKPTL